MKSSLVCWVLSMCYLVALVSCQSAPVMSRESDCALFKTGEPLALEVLKSRAVSHGFDLTEDHQLEAESADSMSAPSSAGDKIYVLRKNVSTKNDVLDLGKPSRKILVRLRNGHVLQARCTDVHPASEPSAISSDPY